MVFNVIQAWTKGYVCVIAEDMAKRFFINVLPKVGKVIISGRENRHIRAARVKAGELVQLFDSKGNMAHGEVKSPKMPQKFT